MDNTKTSTEDCFVCQKHRGDVFVPGGAVYEDDLVYAGHAAIWHDESTIYLGSLLVEPKRHVPGMAELSEREAARIGVVCRRLSIALKKTEAAEHIYLFVLGHHVPHLHIWLIPRYPGTPREYWGLNIDQWPEAPKGGPDEITALCDRVRIFLLTLGRAG